MKSDYQPVYITLKWEGKEYDECKNQANFISTGVMSSVLLWINKSYQMDVIKQSLVILIIYFENLFKSHGKIQNINFINFLDNEKDEFEYSYFQKAYDRIIELIDCPNFQVSSLAQYAVEKYLNKFNSNKKEIELFN